MFAQPSEKRITCLLAATVKTNSTPLFPCICTLLLLLLAIAGCGTATIESTCVATNTLDKTDCNNVVLDDSEFTENIVRDPRDNSYGALSNAEVRPLGGDEGYSKIVPRPATVVRTAYELRTALRAAARSPQTIYVDDDAEIDLSCCAKTPMPRDCREPRSGPTKIRRLTWLIVAISRSPSPRTRRSRAAAGAPGHAARVSSRARSPGVHCWT